MHYYVSEEEYRKMIENNVNQFLDHAKRIREKNRLAKFDPWQPNIKPDNTEKILEKLEIIDKKLDELLTRR